jgi:hypothetical protein
MVKHIVQSIQFLFAVSALRLGKNFTKANQLSVDSDYAYWDYTLLNKTFLGRDCLKINSSKYVNCQTTRQECILSSKVQASTPVRELLGNTIHRSLNHCLC